MSKTKKTPQDLFQSQLTLLAAHEPFDAPFPEAKLSAALRDATINPNIFISTRFFHLPGFFVALGHGSPDLARLYLDHPQLDRLNHGMDHRQDRCISSFAYTAYRAMDRDSAFGHSPSPDALAVLSLLGSDARLVPDTICIGYRCNWKDSLFETMALRDPDSTLPLAIESFLCVRDLYLAQEREAFLQADLIAAVKELSLYPTLRRLDKNTFSRFYPGAAKIIESIDSTSLDQMVTVSKIWGSLFAEKTGQLFSLVPPCQSPIVFDSKRFQTTFVEAARTGVCRAGQREAVDIWHPLHLSPCIRTAWRLLDRLSEEAQTCPDLPASARRNAAQCLGIMTQENLENRALLSAASPS